MKAVRVPSESTPGVQHTVILRDDGSTTCNCPAWQHGLEHCKHQRLAAESRAERTKMDVALAQIQSRARALAEAAKARVGLGKYLASGAADETWAIAEQLNELTNRLERT